MLNQYKNYSYCRDTGNVTSKVNHRVLSPSLDLHYTLHVEGKKIKIKADRLCWMLGNMQTIPQGYKVLHRNMQQDDNRLRNLLVLPSSEYFTTVEAYRNLTENLSLSLHPKDKYSYLIKYKHKGASKQEIFADEIPARKRLVQLQLKMYKTLSKYCLFD